jgi:hypothetical protein
MASSLKTADELILGGTPVIIDIEDAARHREAMEEGRNTYVDTKTGYNVFTEKFHLERGVCCGSRCRHCPYGHVNVKNKSHAKG